MAVEKFAFVVILVLATSWLSGQLDVWSPTAQLAWGLVSRGFGLVYVIVLGSFHGQVVPLCGRRGVTPVAEFLCQAQKDFPGMKKWLYFPTWLWLNDSDAALQATTLSGILGGLLAVYGGTLGWCGLLIARLALQSLAVTGEFWFVWDYMVFEAGALVLLLPEAEALPALGATRLPLPCVALAWQVLAIRLMLGFAKTKFGKANVAKDNLFLQGFFIWQLLPNHLAWYLHHAPLWLLRASYGFMLYVEVILPFCAFFAGAPRMVAAYGLIILMVGIFLTGNWGQFNLGYIVVCVGLLDLEVSWTSFFHGSWLLAPLLVVYLWISFICLTLFDTWTNTAFPWLYWRMLPEFQLHNLLGLIRGLAPFRLINAYGVFPPEALPQVRSTLIFQGSNDGTTWKTYPYKYQPFCSTSPPRTGLAPHHPRLDHRVFYPFEMTSKSDFCSAYCITDHNPYCFSPEGFMQRMAQRLLEHEPSVLSLFAGTPFASAPAQVRVIVSAVSPTSLEHQRSTGHWWHVQQLCEVIPPRKNDPGVWKRWLPSPESFHPEHEVWTARSALDQAVPEKTVAAVDAFVGQGLPDGEVSRFWKDFIAAAQPGHGDWKTLGSRAKAISARFSRDQLALYERILGRYVLLLRRTLSPEIVHSTGLHILMGNWRLHLLLQDVVASGQDVYMATLQKPETLSERVKQVDEGRLLDLLALLRPDDMLFEDLKFRYILKLKQRADRPGFIADIKDSDKGGFYSMLDYLQSQPPLAPLWLPEARLQDSGAWVVEGYEDQPKTGNPLTEPMLR